ncbi:MAG: hypothetical protein RJA99_4600, partial [Pseudomonadota bacterium]
MTFVYLTTDAPERFPAPGEDAEPVLLNANKKQFCLIASPSRQAIASMIEDYAGRRLDAHWQFLMEPHSARCISLFQIAQRKCVYAPPSVLQRSCGVDSQAALRTALESMSLAEQRKRVRHLKPASIPEMLAFFSDTKLHDMTGYSYLHSVLSRSNDAFAFFGRLIDEFLLGLAGTDYELGTPKSNFHQPRVLEFLGLATAANWLLFPFVHRSSGLWEHQVLSHHANVAGYFDPAYRPSETQSLMDDLRRAEANSPSHVKLVAQLRNLVVCSTYRRIEQSSTALFRRCLELIGQDERPMIPQQVGMARITFNALIRLHQVQCPNAPNQPVLIRARKAPTVAEFSDFPEFRAQGERWTVWADTMQQFVASGTRSDPQTLKTACLDLVEFLLSMRSPPSRPELTERRHINTMTESGECFRNFLREKHSSAAVRNGRLNLVSQFFDFVRASLLAEYRGPAHQAPWFAPPVDIKLDRFQERYRAGTQRKAIAAEVLELMREVLVENDYAWSKAQTAWVNLPDRKTGRLEYVWCPSSAILLYLMLSVPLRSLQARMLDSGEGDASLYDFDSARMVRNRNQLPVEGRIDPARREGLLSMPELISSFWPDEFSPPRWAGAHPLAAAATSLRGRPGPR